MDKEKVWVSDPQDGFVLGQIVDLTDDGAVVQPLIKSKSPVEASFDRLYPAEEDESKEVDDNCGLMYLNEATLLQNIKLRYNKDKIYTYVANILIAINPYDDIRNLYDSKTIKAYQGKRLGKNLFSISQLMEKLCCCRQIPGNNATTCFCHR